MKIYFCLLFLVPEILHAQEMAKPSKIVTGDFCKTQDLSPFIKTWDETGTDGVFDNSFWRIQIHFESVTRDANDPLVYHVTGASRHRKNVTPFKGQIVIREVQLYEGDYDWLQDTSGIIESNTAKKYISCKADYNLFEDSTKKFSGLFTGDLRFSLHLENNSILLDDMQKYQRNAYSNFIFEGIWKEYKSGLSVLCTWGNGHIPVPAGVDTGTETFRVADKYIKNGWKKDENGVYTDNPKYWWK